MDKSKLPNIQPLEPAIGPEAGTLAAVCDGRVSPPLVLEQAHWQRCVMCEPAIGPEAGILATVCGGRVSPRLVEDQAHWQRCVMDV